METGMYDAEIARYCGTLCLTTREDAKCTTMVPGMKSYSYKATKRELMISNGSEHICGVDCYTQSIIQNIGYMKYLLRCWII